MVIRGDCIQRPTTPSPRVPAGGLPYKVKDGESWGTVAQRNNMEAWALIRFNYPTLPPVLNSAVREVNWYLKEYVGCRQLTRDGCNYMFSSSADPGLIYLPGPCAEPPEELKVPVNYWRSRLAVPFIYKEMIANAQSREAAEIRGLLSGDGIRDAFPFTGEPGERAARAGMAASGILQAGLKWKQLVQTNAVWDHKPVLRRMLNLQTTDMHFPIEGDPDHEYFYDFWSNIHYGYVGRAAGFSGGVLQWGAARGGAAGRNDPIDVETVQIGIDLWDRYGLKLQQQQLTEEVLRRTPKMLQLQETAEYTGPNGDFRHITPVTDGQ